MLRSGIFCLTFWFGVGVILAQPKVRFDQTRHDFGTVPESAGSVSFEFRFVNQGNIPLILTDVRSSCDCTVPEWPREPILPKKQGVVKVVFETTGNPGIFDKAITVYTNTREGSVALRITGNVERSNIPVRPEFSQTMGGLQLTRRYLSMGEMTNRQVVTGEIETFNPGKKPVTVAFDNIPPHMEVLALPAVIQPGEKGKIRVVYDASSRNDWGYVSDRIQLVVDGSVYPAFSILVTADISEDFSKWTARQLQTAPKMEFVRSSLTVGVIRMNEQKTLSVMFKNSGNSPLLLRKVDTGCECMKVVKSPLSVAPGATGEIVFSYLGENPLGNQQRTLTVRCNDPVHSVQNMRIQAQIVE